MIRRCIHLALFAVLSAAPSFAAEVAPVQKAAPPQWQRCQGGAGISADDRIASCTSVIDAAETPNGLRADALRARCLLLSEKDEDSAAIADCDRAVALDPQNRESFITRGKAYRNAKDFNRAVADFNRALAIKPDSAGVLTLRGLAYYEMGDYDRAIADYSAAIKLWPEVRLPKSLLAQAMEAKAKRDGNKK